MLRTWSLFRQAASYDRFLPEVRCLASTPFLAKKLFVCEEGRRHTNLWGCDLFRH